MNRSLIPEKYRILSGSALKVIAVVTMLIDHIGYTLLPYAPIDLFTVFGKRITVYYLARLIGRIAFPLFCFLLTEGFLHTKSRIRYAINLGVFALLSEIPFNLMMNGTLRYLNGQNVLFTLLFGMLGIWAIEQLQDRPVRMAVALCALLLASLLFKADYGVSGFCFILLLYVLRKQPVLRAIVGTGMLSNTWKAGLAFVPIAFYNGKRGFIRGRVFKYAFYLFYPAHILVLCWIRFRLFGK